MTDSTVTTEQRLYDLVYFLPVIAFTDGGKVVALFDITSTSGQDEAFSYGARNTRLFVRFGGNTQLNAGIAVNQGLTRWRESADAAVVALARKAAA